MGVQQAAGDNGGAAPSGKPSTGKQLMLFDQGVAETEPRWVEVNVSAVYVENCRQFGEPWLNDVSNTFFEGQVPFKFARRGYSRGQRNNRKQVCIGLVVFRCGMPLGYEVFAGNMADVTTVQQNVTTMQQCYGKSDRVWVTDREMVSEAVQTEAPRCLPTTRTIGSAVPFDPFASMSRVDGSARDSLWQRRHLRVVKGRVYQG